jgi:Cu-Zn family superoxide dismutase
MKLRNVVMLSVLTLVLGACAHGGHHASHHQSLEARAQLITAKPEHKNVAGDIGFTEQKHGVRVRVMIRGLKPLSAHGFHIHEGTECKGPGFETAGGHFNPGKHDHGGPDSSVRHAGDLGNVTADAQGVVSMDQVFQGFTLGEGPTSVIGKAMILHEKADDLTTQPTGNAGGRMACALIGLVSK